MARTFKDVPKIKAFFPSVQGEFKGKGLLLFFRFYRGPIFFFFLLFKC